MVTPRTTRGFVAGGFSICSAESEAFALMPGPNASPLSRAVPCSSLLSVPKTKLKLRDDKEEVFDERDTGVLCEGDSGGRPGGGGGASKSSKRSLGDSFFSPFSLSTRGDKPHSLKSIGSEFLIGSSGALALILFNRDRLLVISIGEIGFESDLGEYILALESEPISM